VATPPAASAPLKSWAVRPALLVAGLALFAAAVSAFLGQRVFGGVPHVADGVSYAFQGKVFAAGRPWLEPPLVPDAFKSQNILLNGTRWCSLYPPGFPLLLAAGWFVGAPFLVNPVLLGLAILGVFRLGRVLYDDATGLLGALLLAVSPFALLMGAGFMSHVASLCVFTWCLAFLAESWRGIGARPLLMAGFLAAFGVVVRPQAAVLFLLPALIAALAARRRELARSIGFLGLGGAAPLAFLFAYNFALSGNPLRMGYVVNDPTLSFSLTSFAFGFSPSRLFWTHFPWFLHDLDATVWGFPWGDLALLAFLLIPAPGRRRDAWLAACVLALVIGFSFFRFYDLSHSGPRYAFEALGALALLAARAFRTAGGLAASLLGRLRLERYAAGAAVVAVGFLAVFPLVKLLPERRGGRRPVGPHPRRGKHRGVDLRLLPPRERVGPTACTTCLCARPPAEAYGASRCVPAERVVARERHPRAAAAPERMDRQYLGRRRRRLEQTPVTLGGEDEGAYSCSRASASAAPCCK